MDECQVCGKTIFDSSRSYREKVKFIREKTKNEDLKICDCCASKFIKTRNKIMLDNIIQEALGKIFNKYY